MLEQPDFKPETIGDEVIKNICDTTDTSVVLALTLRKCALIQTATKFLQKALQFYRSLGGTASPSSTLAPTSSETRGASIFPGYPSIAWIASP